VSVTNGTLTDVAVADGQGVAVPGDVAADGLAWQSAEPLVPQAAYTVQVAAVGTDQRPFEQTLAVTTSAPSVVLRAILSPGDGEVVGIGMPAVVTFNRAVAQTDRAAVEDRLTLSANPPVEGAWRWITPARVHWRPAVYWQPGTEVGVHTDLRGLRVGDAWGAEEERTIHFRVGDAHVSTVDVNTHQMTVTENGQVVRIIDVSTGRARYPTNNGVHLALEKSRTVTMDSSTVGIPRNSPGGYLIKAAWATRLSYSGTYLHAAPWSAGAQGQRNVSHGCINVSTANAQWFYNFTRRGDVVDVVNSPAKPKLYDPGMADWNIPWEQWKAGDTA
ncbi:MAG TPA: Ig-like domain-containing protein, partial [Acidimicrobiia bacterium]|nr:Ig-like domain-containing protein [Acidimicrobiia bacterium]